MSLKKVPIIKDGKLFLGHINKKGKVVGGQPAEIRHSWRSHFKVFHTSPYKECVLSIEELKKLTEVNIEIHTTQVTKWYRKDFTTYKLPEINFEYQEEGLSYVPKDQILEYKFESAYMENFLEDVDIISSQEDEWINYVMESPLIRLINKKFGAFLKPFFCFMPELLSPEPHQPLTNYPIRGLN